MTTQSKPYLCAFALTALAACSGGGGSALAPVSPAAPAAADSLFPGTSQATMVGLDADEIAARAALLDATTTNTTLVNTNWAYAPKPVRPSSFSGTLEEAELAAITPQSYHGADDGGLTGGGQAGISFMNPRGMPYGLIATHDIYQPQTQLQLPVAPTGYNNWLDAPTTRGVGWTCLEIGTSYSRGSVANSPTYASVYVNDLCGGPGWTASVDATFWNKYVTRATRARPAHYQLANLTTTSLPSTLPMSVTPMSPPGWHPSAQWHAELFNVVTRKWDVVYSVYGRSMENGWTMYETHYQAAAGQSVSCPHGLPTIGAEDITLVTPTGSSYFTDANSSVYTPLPGETSFGAFGACFNADAGPDGKMSPASNVFNLISPNYAWSVSNRH